jgi:hypothetical protein
LLPPQEEVSHDSIIMQPVKSSIRMG